MWNFSLLIFSSVPCRDPITRPILPRKTYQRPVVRDTDELANPRVPPLRSSSLPCTILCCRDSGTLSNPDVNTSETISFRLTALNWYLSLLHVVLTRVCISFRLRDVFRFVSCQDFWWQSTPTFVVAEWCRRSIEILW